MKDISPQEALRRIRRFFPASREFNVSIEAKLVSYSRTDEWHVDRYPDGHDTFFRYEISVWNEQCDWRYGSSQLAVFLNATPQAQSVSEALEMFFRYLPVYEAPEETERASFFTADEESEVAA